MSVTRGFARTKDQADWLRSHGLPDKAIYQTGRGAEDLDECLATYRGRAGKLLVAHDLRVFGKTKREVADTMARLETAKIRVVDISHPKDFTISEMIQRANVAISGTRMDHRAAKRRGRKGGLGKGVGAYNLRESIAPAPIVDRIVDCQEIPWPLKLQLLGPEFSATTLRRHYGARAKAKRAQ